MEDSRKRPIDGEGSEDDKDIKKAKGDFSEHKLGSAKGENIDATAKQELKSSFGLRGVPVLETLREYILQQYSESQILKEFVQQADDSGATKLEFILDERQHGVKNLKSAEMAAYQGAAFYAKSDSVFSMRDWNRIQHPFYGIESQDPLQSGRFCVGLNVMYQLTDLPGILSGQFVGFLDPQEVAFSSDDFSRSGYMVDLQEDMSIVRSLPDQFAPFKMVLSDAENNDFDSGYFPGTVLRFPLRSHKSQVSSKTCNAQLIRGLCASFLKEARLMLLFVKHLQSVSLYHIDKEGNKKLTGMIEVSQGLAEREKFTEKLKACTMMEKLNPESAGQVLKMTTKVSLRQGSDSDNLDTTESEWLISHFLAGADDFQVLCEHSRTCGLLPWVAVGAPMSRADKRLGRLFDQLPFPDTESSVCPLPVHVHGSFNISPDKRSIKWPELGTKSNDDDMKRNHTMLTEVVPRAYEQLVKYLISSDSDSQTLYSLLPVVPQRKSVWELCVRNIYGLLRKNDVQFLRAENAWVGCLDERLVSNCLTQEDAKYEELLIDCLTKADKRVVRLPTHIFHGLKSSSAQTSFQEITPDFVGECLAGNEEAFSKEQRMSFLEYLLTRGKGTSADGLKLLPLASGEFAVIGEKEETVYLESDDCNSSLLPMLKNKFLSPDIDEKLLSKLEVKPAPPVNRKGRAKRAASTASPAPKGQIQKITPEVVVSYLPQTIPESWKGMTEVKWTPGVDNQPTKQWLMDVWEFLSARRAPAGSSKAKQQKQYTTLTSDLKQMTLLPKTWEGEEIVLLALEGNLMIYKTQGDVTLTDDISEILNELNVHIVEPQPWMNHPQLDTIVSPTPDGVMGLLQKVDIGLILQLQPAALLTLKDYITSNLSDATAGKICKFLQKIPLFKLYNSADEALVPALDTDGKLAKGMSPLSSPPPESFKLPEDTRLIDVTEPSERKLAEQIKIPILTQKEYIKTFVLSAVDGLKTNLAKEDFVELMLWLVRLHEEIGAADLKVLSQTEFVLTSKGEFKAPQAVHDPRDALAKLLYEVPDEKFSEPDILEALSKMGLKKVSAGADATTKGPEVNVVQELKNILEGYSTHLDLVTEFIQNADDAGATEVKLLVDLRKNGDKNQKLFDPKMQTCQGPALVFYNNAKFTEDDFERLKNIGGDSKRVDPSKIGHFGKGFNLVYRVTDTPAIVSGGVVMFLDPSQSYIPEAWGSKNVKFNLLQHPNIAEEYDDQFYPMKTIFGVTLEPETEMDFQNTLFRLPWRSSAVGGEKEISSQVFTEQDAIDLLNECATALPDMLLFLPNVTSLSAYVLKDGNSPAQPDLLFEVKKTNLKYIRTVKSTHAERKSSFLEVASNFVKSWTTSKQYIPAETAQVQIDVKVSPAAQEYLHLDDRDESNQWLVSQCCGSKESMHKGNQKIMPGFNPCGGVACLLDHGYESFSGKLFSFLPLPEETKLPVHVNGYFLLSSDRKSIKPKEKINESLLKDPICQAYANLLEDHSSLICDEQDVSKVPKLILQHVQLLPSASEVSGSAYAELLVESVLFSIFSKTLFPVYSSDTQVVFHSLKDVHFICSPDQADMARLLKQIGMTTSDAYTVYDDLKKVGLKPLELNANTAVNFLKSKDCKLNKELNKPPTLDLEEIKSLLKYCCQDSRLNLQSLPLLITGDGVLRRFNKNQQVFFTDNDLLKAAGTSSVLHEDFKDILKDFQTSTAFKVFSLKHLEKQVPRVLKNGEPVNQTDEEVPELSWFLGLWNYLEKSPNDLKAIESWAILPTKQEVYYTPRTGKRIVFFKEDATSLKLREVLEGLGCPELHPSLNEVQVALKCVTVSTEIKNVVENIFPFLELGKLSKDDQSYVLSQVESQLVAKETLSLAVLLEYLPLLETVHEKGITKEIYGSSDNPNIWILPDGIPDNIVQKVQPDPAVILLRDQHKPTFYSRLKIKPMTPVIFYVKFVCPFVSTSDYTEEERQGVMETVKRLTEEVNQGEVKFLQHELSALKFIPDKNGQLQKPSFFFASDNPAITSLGETFTEELPQLPVPYSQEMWQPFLKQLNLQIQIDSSKFLDLFKILSAAEKQKELGKEVIEQRALNLLEILTASKHLYSDKNLLKKLAQMNILPMKDVSSSLLTIQPVHYSQESFLAKPKDCLPVSTEDLVWTEVPLVHPDANQWLEKENLQGQFGMVDKPTVKQVAKHCSNLSEGDVTKEPMVFTRVLNKIYSFFDQARKQGLRQDDIKILKSSDLVFIQSGDRMIRPDMAIMGVEQNLEPYFIQVHEAFKEFAPLFTMLGTVEGASLELYSQILQKLQKKYGEEKITDENDLKLAKTSMQQALKNEEELANLSELFLLSKEDILFRSTDLVYDDTNLPVPEELAKCLVSSDVKCYPPNKDVRAVLDSLPKVLHPKRTSQLYVERLAQDKCQPCLLGDECPLQKRYRTIIESDEFKEALAQIAKQDGVKNMNEDKIRKCLEKIKFSCVKSICTAQSDHAGRQVGKEQKYHGEFFIEEQYRNGGFVVLTRHDSFPGSKLLQSSISKVLNEVLNANFKSWDTITSLLRMKTPSQIPQYMKTIAVNLTGPARGLNTWQDVENLPSVSDAGKLMDIAEKDLSNEDSFHHWSIQRYNRAAASAVQACYLNLKKASTIPSSDIIRLVSEIDESTTLVTNCVQLYRAYEKYESQQTHSVSVELAKTTAETMKDLAAKIVEEVKSLTVKTETTNGTTA